MDVPWSALLGWADDTPLLEPLGMQRSFYRVETYPDTGRLAPSDQRWPINITTWHEKLAVMAPNQQQDPALQQAMPGISHALRFTASAAGHD